MAPPQGSWSDHLPTARGSPAARNAGAEAKGEPVPGDVLSERNVVSAGGRLGDGGGGTKTLTHHPTLGSPQPQAQNNGSRRRGKEAPPDKGPLRATTGVSSFLQVQLCGSLLPPRRLQPRSCTRTEVLGGAWLSTGCPNKVTAPTSPSCPISSRPHGPQRQGSASHCPSEISVQGDWAWDRAVPPSS